MARRSVVRAWVDEWIDRSALQHPARLAIGSFAIVIAAATGLLCLPFATASGHRPPFIDSLFVGTSAVTVTSLTTVDTGTYWSPFGKVVILVSMQAGGLGIMTMAALLGLAVSRKLGLTSRMVTADEVRANGPGDVRILLRTIFIVTAVVEGVIALVLFIRLLAHGFPVATAAFQGVFYAVSGYTNAGFVAEPGGIVPFPGDAFFRLTMAAGPFLGALGFPVYLNLVRSWRKPKSWSLHTKLTLVTIAVLQTVSVVVLAAFEWTNPATLGALSGSSRVWQLLFVSVNQRTGGLSGIDHGAMHEHTWLLEDVLMFIGGGSGGTSGGIKVTTLAVLLLAIWAEARGRRDIEAFGKRIGTEVLRLAVAVTLVSLFVVIVGSGVVLAQSVGQGFTLGQVVFEVTSAFATVGISTGITPFLPFGAKVTVIIVMFIGRVGSLTVVAALALNRQRRVIRYPSERPLIG
jgi:trk system potassium uptake protein